MPDFGESQGAWNGHYINAIERHSDHGKLLEIGFGDASFLALARDRGWETYGADLSLPLAQRARTELGLPNIEIGTLDTLNYPDGFFDVVAGFNFLEHVVNPRETLKSIRRILRPGGVAAIMCPNISGIFHVMMVEILGELDPLKISWCPPDHLNYFNKKNLQILFEEAGFKVVEDASEEMHTLWRQHEVVIGPPATDPKLDQLLARISNATSAKGDERVTEFRDEIKTLLLERMTWTMISDLMKLEPALGAECGIFYVAKKVV
jgi:SAM-dependent methyltransferase